MNSQDSFRLPGLTSAVFTPMHEDGTVNPGRIGPLVEFLIQDGVSSLFVAGSTGEGLSLSSQERRLVTEAFVEAAGGRVPVVIHVGHNCLDEAYALARHAQDTGASAISAVAPFYFKPDSPETLIRCLARITAGAPELPFYYYHIPTLTGADVDLAALIRLCKDRLLTMVGIKYSDPRLHLYMAAQSANSSDSLDFVFGVDEMLLSAWAAGMRGAVGSTYNFAAPLYQKIISSFMQGDLDRARTLQARAAAMIDIILRTCGRTGFKALMSVIGVDCGPCRLPQSSPAPKDIRRMTHALEAIGFFEWGRLE